MSAPESRILAAIADGEIDKWGAAELGALADRLDHERTIAERVHTALVNTRSDSVGDIPQRQLDRVLAMEPDGDTEDDAEFQRAARAFIEMMFGSLFAEIEKDRS